MSSPPRRSRFTYRDFHQLAKCSVDTPLRVITHIDLDAFYAQCEMKRIGVGPEVPLAVQQWQNLIAVNYAARPSGVTRHITAKEATDLCPELKLVHVAVWKAGEEHWSYSDTTPDITTCKACLDPYRAESKKILAVFKAACPDAHLEKAGIDESFLDLSKVVHDKMLEVYEVLRLPPPFNGPLESLPLPDQKVLDWCGSHLVASEFEDHEVGETEVEQVDWDDIVMAVGAKMVRFIRDEVKRELGYTCSAGISSNKMVAKLGSGYRKPNQQSIVRPLAIKPFLNTFEFVKIRNLGGKLGTQISEHFSTTSITELLEKPLSAFQSILSDDTATWVYNVIRGIDKSPITPRSAIKSMLSAKSFRTPLPQGPTQALPWLKVFCADIFSRIEDDSDPVLRRPKGMTLNFTSKSGISRGRQAPVPAGGTLDKEVLFCTAEMLMKHHIGAEGPSMWPLIRLSMNVSGFEEKEPGNVDIGAFLVRGQQAVELRERQAERTERTGRGLPQSSYTRDGRKRVVDPGISRFFGAGVAAAATPQETETDTEAEKSPPLQEENGTAASPAAYEIPTFPCEDCGVPVPIDETDEHRDWHFAKSLQQQDRENDSVVVASASRSSAPPPPAVAGKKRKGGRQDPKMEKGQKKLAF